MTDALQEAIERSGVPHAQIERETGVHRGSIARFLRGETSLRLDIADRLAAYFGIKVTLTRRKR